MGRKPDQELVRSYADGFKKEQRLKEEPRIIANGNLCWLVPSLNGYVDNIWLMVNFFTFYLIQ